MGVRAEAETAVAMVVEMEEVDMAVAREILDPVSSSAGPTLQGRWQPVESIGSTVT